MSLSPQTRWRFNVTDIHGKSCIVHNPAGFKRDIRKGVTSVRVSVNVSNDNSSNYLLEDMTIYEPLFQEISPTLAFELVIFGGNAGVDWATCMNQMLKKFCFKSLRIMFRQNQHFNGIIVPEEAVLAVAEALCDGLSPDQLPPLSFICLGRTSLQCLGFLASNGWKFKFAHVAYYSYDDFNWNDLGNSWQLPGADITVKAFSEDKSISEQVLRSLMPTSGGKARLSGFRIADMLNNSTMDLFDRVKKLEIRIDIMDRDSTEFNQDFCGFLGPVSTCEVVVSVIAEGKFKYLESLEIDINDRIEEHQRKEVGDHIVETLLNSAYQLESLDFTNYDLSSTPEGQQLATIVGNNRAKNQSEV